MRKAFIILNLILGTMSAGAQDKGFVVKGNLNLPDGYEVGIVCQTDTAYSVEMAQGVIKGGRFEMKGNIGKPLPGTLMTNNLKLVEKNNWPTDSIRWTYNDIFLSSGELTFTNDYKLNGGQIQADFNAYKAMEGEDGETKDWTFIEAHPQSVVSVWLANKLLERGYNLTMEQVEHLEKTITSVPEDTARYAEFVRRIAYAKKTTKGGDLVDLELNDKDGNVCHLLDIIPKNRYVLVDFWASWCGICIAAMPEIRKIAEEYPVKFAVIAVSIDTKPEAWRKAMEKHPEPWPQYITTKNGYSDLFTKYQVGNGVPYYLMITPDGKVLNSPSTPQAVREILEKYN